MGARVDVAVIGAGQAGLATSHQLAQRGVDHVVLERGRVGETWRGRWDSFCFVTPNWSMQLPGRPYDGADLDGFDPRDEIVGFLERYARDNAAPLEEGVEVERLERDGRGFRLSTSRGELDADQVVICSGAYQRAHRPPAASALPTDVPQLDVPDYTRPSDLEPGPILVVGSGQSGCQIAEELHESGREVFLACGRAPWAPRRIGDADLFWWLEESGFLATPTHSLPDPDERLIANILVSGRDGGHDLNLRTLHARGVRLLGHLAGAEGRRARFQADLPASLAWGDGRYERLRGVFDSFAAERGIDQPELPAPSPLDLADRVEVDLTGFGAVIFAGGFRPDYGAWVDIPAAFGEQGFPVHENGTSAAAPGLHFAGVHFLTCRKSALMIGVGDDAELVAGSIAEKVL